MPLCGVQTSNIIMPFSSISRMTNRIYVLSNVGACLFGKTRSITLSDIYLFMDSCIILQSRAMMDASRLRYNITRNLHIIIRNCGGLYLSSPGGYMSLYRLILFLGIGHEGSVGLSVCKVHISATRWCLFTLTAVALRFCRATEKPPTSGGNKRRATAKSLNYLP
jgi:hypothetical protein